MTLQTPINGRVSDIVGRKPMLYAAILVFTVFSALCGAAKSMNWSVMSLLAFRRNVEADLYVGSLSAEPFKVLGEARSSV